MGLLSTPVKVGNKAVRGLLDMDTSSRMARANDQGYNTDVYHGSTHDLTNMDALKTSIEGDWGQGIYSSNNIDDVNANYAGLGPDLTSRIDRRMDDIDSRIDGYEFEDLINAFPEMTKKEAKSIASGNSEVFETFKRRVATKEIAGPNSGVVYPLKLKTEDYAVIDIKNPTRIEGRDYYAEAADDLDRSDFGSDDDYEDALYELADDFRASDYDSPLETISQTLRDSGADDYTIEEIIQKVSDDDYFSDMSSLISATSKVNLPQEAYLNYSTDKLDVNFVAQRYQNLTTSSSPYERLPSLSINHSDEHENFSGFSSFETFM